VNDEILLQPHNFDKADWELKKDDAQFTQEAWDANAMLSTLMGTNSASPKG
jgi:hypothetical protein